MKITELWRYGYNPAQWIGKDDLERDVFIRYAKGRLDLMAGALHGYDFSQMKLLIRLEFNDQGDNSMSNEEMVGFLRKYEVAIDGDIGSRENWLNRDLGRITSRGRSKVYDELDEADDDFDSSPKDEDTIEEEQRV